MKFRARLSKENLLSLHGVAATLTKINATAVVFLTEDRVRFAAIQENIDAPRIFAEIDALGMFHEYRVQSQTSNTILFELNMEQLTKSLYSGRNSATCQLKLVKRDDKPCLCFESKANEGFAINIEHDIPLKMMKPADIVHYLPPELPPPTVALELPKGKLIRTMIDRLGRISKNIDVTGYQTGRLVFRVEHSSASIKSLYSGVQPYFDGNLDEDVDAENVATVGIEVRKFSQVIGLSALMYSRALLFLRENAPVMVHVSLAPAGASLGSLSYYVPVLLNTAMEEDEGNSNHDDDDDDDDNAVCEKD